MISEKNIKRWLENWEAFDAGDQLPGAESGGGGPKSQDGVSGSRLNRIMMRQALDKLREKEPFSFRALDMRYLRPIKRADALQALRVSSEVYSRGIREGLAFIYVELNPGPAVLAKKKEAADPYEKLLEKILGKP